MLRCPDCAHDNPDNARFCNQCGHALASAALADERKQVSVLFADVKGSMELLAGLDPEDARRLLDPMLEHMMEAVHHHDGTVNQVMGDGIMALFGAPVAHEDHAVRACCAALRMQAAVARHGTICIRVGIHSGEVVVRSIDSGLHKDYSAVGQTTHVAARMEQAARPGTILVTGTTLDLARGAIEAKPLGPLRVAGLREPVQAHELLGARLERRRLGAARQGRFVGRDGEMAALSRAIDLVRGGQGQVVTIVGEAGVGKSRLLREFVHGESARGCLVLEASCLSYGKAEGYLPFVDMLRSYFAIDEPGDAHAVRERVSARLVLLDRLFETVSLALWALLDVLPADTPWQRFDLGRQRRAILDAIRQLLLRECQRRPVVLVFEDLHCIDAESLALLDALVESAPTMGLLLLGSRRPPEGPSWPGVPHCRDLALEPLPRAIAEDLVDALLGRAGDLDALRRQLIERTEGNPLFIEECVSALAESGVLAGPRGAHRLSAREPAMLSVPATVHAILAARIDALAPADKALLQAASVIGKDVPFALLSHVTGLDDDALRATLARLEAGAFVHEASVMPELRYSFKHALTHEVGYASLLGPRRRELHARVVDAIESLHAPRIGEHLEQLAHHALRGGLGPKAIAYLGDAAGKAITRSAYRNAIGFLEDALRLLESLPETDDTLARRLALRMRLGPVLRASKGDWDDDVQACFAGALALCDRVGGDADRFAILLGLWACHDSRGEYGQASAWAARLVDMADAGDASMRLRARHSQWSTAIAAGRPADALDGLEQAQPPMWLDDAEDLSWDEMHAVGHWLLGHFDRARDAVVRGVSKARRTGRSSATVLANLVAAVIHYHRGERGTAMLHAKAAASLGRSYGVMNWPEHAAIIVARLLAEEGRGDEALRLAEASLPRALCAGWSWFAALSFGLVADLHGRVGQPARGLEMLRSLDLQRHDGLYGAELHRLHAGLALAVAPHATDEAQARLREAVTMARERRLKSLELRAAIGLAHLLTPGDRRAARAALAVVDEFTEGAQVGDLRTARMLRQWLE